MRYKGFLILVLLLNYVGFSQENETIKIMGVGDIMMGTSFPNKSFLPPKGKNPFEKVQSVLSKADILFGNLEGTLTDKGKNAKHCKDPSKCYSFRTPTYMGQFLESAGFDVMSIANNHIGDFGKVGIQETLATLEKHQIASAGLLSKPYTIFEKNGLTIGFVAFAPNNHCLKLNNIQKAKELVSMLSKKCDIVMVSFHGGAEGSKHRNVTKKTEYFYGENRGNVYQFAHTVIDAGADIVFGHGPHVSRAIEVYKNKFISYSLGNFCTYERFSLGGVKGFAPIINVEVNKKGDFVKGNIYSAKQVDGIYPYLDEKKAAFKEIKNLTSTDFPNGDLIFHEDGSFSKKN